MSEPLQNSTAVEYPWQDVGWRVWIGLVLLAVALVYVPQFTPDFGQDYAAARAWWDGNDPNGLTVDLLADCCPALSRRYAEIAPEMQTAHPPTATLLALPLSRLDWSTARIVWLVISWVAVVATWQYRRVPLSACLATTPLWVFVLGIGTHEALLFLLLAMTFSADERRSIWAGIPLAFSIALKVYPILLVLGFAADRRWKPILVAVVAGAFLVMLSELVLGIGVHRGWLEYVPVNAANYSSDERNASLVRILRQILPGVSSLLMSAFVALILVIPLLRQKDRSIEERRFLPIMLLASPLSWRYYWGALSLQRLRRVDLFCLFLPPTILLLGLAGVLPATGWNRFVESVLVVVVQLPLLVIAVRLWYCAVIDVRSK